MASSKALLLRRVGLLAAAFAIGCNCFGADLEQAFTKPPASAKPWTYWFWINGNITRDGITADLEAMAKAGIGGVLIMEVANPKSMAPTGPVAFAGPEWRELFKHVIAECRRLGLQVNMNNDAGWCGSGGPWMPVELSMQDLVATNVVVTGPGRLSEQLPKPKVVAGYYRDLKVLAFPDRPTRAPIAKTEVLNISDKMDEQGQLAWDVPAGKWNVVRVGVTTTGATNKPAPASGQGLECDKFNPRAMERHFESFINELADDNQADLGKTFALTHIDSWEVGDQDWTPRMAEEFLSRRGYDLTPWLATLVGRKTIESPEMTERFRWDFTRTKAELNVEAYAGALKKLAHERGLRLSIEAYNGKGFLNPLTYGAVADLPMAEFWIVRWGGWHLLSSRLMASVGHVHGRPIIGAEAFTAWAEADPYTEYPYSVKSIGDWALCEGINQFVFHRTVMDPWTNRVPGMTFAGYGWHMDRNQTWWEPGAAYMQYLTRCQALLQSGRFVADICRLVPTGERFGHGANMRTLPSQYEPIPGSHGYDYISDKALLEEVAVRDGCLQTQSGMRYRVLQLPNERKLTPQLLRKLRDLVRDGAVIAGPRPDSSPSLQNYPQCDDEVQSIGRELWADCDGRTVREHRFDKGLVTWGLPIREVLNLRGIGPDFTFKINPPVTDAAIMSVTQGRGVQRPNEPSALMPTEGINWIHRSEGDADIYFLANPQHRDVDALCVFRVKDRQPELWDPQTGQTRKCVVFRTTSEGIEVPVHFDPAGSRFVVFREKPVPAQNIAEIRAGDRVLFGANCAPQPLPLFRQTSAGFSAVGAPGRYQLKRADGRLFSITIPESGPSQELSGPWKVRFQPGRGAPESMDFPALVDWSKHSNERIRYFSGVATYTVGFDWVRSKQPQQIKLSLGDVQVMAEATLNGKRLPVLWKPPYEVDVSETLQSGRNELQIRVWNLWPNRLIGDEQFPDDCTPDGTWKTGRLPAWPEWLLNGSPRPEPRRLTFTTWKYYTKDSPLQSSGLIGPVRLMSEPLGN